MSYSDTLKKYFSGWGLPPAILSRIEQYGAEQYQKGRMDQEKVELFKLELQAQEAIRLCELVQAQKELIELILSCEVKKGFISMSLGQANQRTKIIDQIKSLEV